MREETVGRLANVRDALIKQNADLVDDFPFKSSRIQQLVEEAMVATIEVAKLPELTHEEKHLLNYVRSLVVTLVGDAMDKSQHGLLQLI